MRLWKRRWFVLADYCLFYYKGELRFRPPRALCARGGGEVIQRWSSQIQCLDQWPELTNNLLTCQSVHFYICGWLGDFIFISPSTGSAICWVKINKIRFAFYLGSQDLEFFQLLPHLGHRLTFDAIWRDEKYRWSIIFYNLLSVFIPCYWMGSWWIKLAIWIFVKPQYIELGAVQRLEGSKAQNMEEEIA